MRRSVLLLIATQIVMASVGAWIDRGIYSRVVKEVRTTSALAGQYISLKREGRL